MTYRTDKPLEPHLISSELLAEEKGLFGSTARLRNSRLGQMISSRWDRMTVNARTYHAPLSERRMLLVIVDTLCLLLAIWGTSLMTTVGPNSILPLWLWAPVLFVSWWVLACFNDLYDVPSSWEGRTSMVRVLRSAGLGIAAYWGMGLLYANLLPTRFLMTFLALGLPLLMLWRLVYAGFSSVLFSPHRVLVVGFEEHDQSIVQLLGPAARLNYQILGFVDDDFVDDALVSETAKPQRAELPWLGQMADLPHLIDSLHIHELLLATHQTPTTELVNSLIRCQGHGVRVSWLADLYENFRRSIPVQEIEPSWALYAIQGQPVFNRLQLVAKRFFDLLLAIFALPTLLLIMPAIAFCIWLDSGGPIFYQQIRAGRGNVPFAIYKFRTMKTDAEIAGVPQWAEKNDPRITRVGRFLRKTRLDELPQIFNILRGDMSFVGPRPERPEFVELLEQTIPLYRTRLLVKPGLTGWAQIHYGYGNGREDALRKLQFDFYYVRHWSLWRDFYVLFQTIAVVIQCKGT